MWRSSGEPSTRSFAELSHLHTNRKWSHGSFVLHFKIGSFLMVEPNIFATPLSLWAVTECRKNVRSGWMKSMWSFSHHLCTTNEQNSSCDGGHIEDAGYPKSPQHFETEPSGLLDLCVSVSEKKKNVTYSSSLCSSHLYSFKKECNITLIGVSLSEPKQNPPFKKKLEIILNPDHQEKNENLQIQKCHLFPHLGLGGSNFMQGGMHAFVQSAV